MSIRTSLSVLCLAAFYSLPAPAKRERSGLTVISSEGYVRLVEADRLRSVHSTDRIPSDTKEIILGKASTCLLWTESWRAFKLRGVATVAVETLADAVENDAPLPGEVKLNVRTLRKLAREVDGQVKLTPTSAIVSASPGKFWLSIPNSESWDPHAASVAVFRQKSGKASDWMPTAAPCRETEDGPWLELELSKGFPKVWEPLWIGYPKSPNRPTYLIHLIRPEEEKELSSLKKDRSLAGQLLLLHLCNQIHYWDEARATLKSLRGRISNPDWSNLKAKLAVAERGDRSSQ